MSLHESGEDYLEAILMLQEKNGSVRSIDVANELGFSKPSVSVAMKKLRESGHIEMEADGLIRLTSSGRTIAEQIYERHRMLTDFFLYLGVDEEAASADACLVEHDLSAGTFEKLKDHILRTIGKGREEAEK